MDLTMEAFAIADFYFSAIGVWYAVDGHRRYKDACSQAARLRIEKRIAHRQVSR